MKYIFTQNFKEISDGLSKGDTQIGTTNETQTETIEETLIEATDKTQTENQ